MGVRVAGSAMFRYLIFSFLVCHTLVLGDPLAKEVIRAMDKVISDHVEWDNWEKWSEIMAEFFTSDMIYDTNWSPDNTMNNSTGIWEWWENEHIPYNMAFDNTTFNQMIFAAEETTATTTTYANTRWKGPFCTVQPSEVMMPATMRIFDFYLMRGNKIFYNWMIIDTVDLMLQAGHRVLPKSPLREGFVRPPNAMDGIPAPISRISSLEDAAVAKEIVQSALFYDLTAEPEAGVSSPYWEVDMLTCEGTYCGAHGYLHANNTGDFLGEKASNKQVRLRFGVHWRVDVARGVIPEGYAIFDLPGFFIQNGIDLYDRMNDPAYLI